MNTWKVILATLVIFVAGLVTGALVVWLSGSIYLPPQQRPANGARTNAPGSLGGTRLEFLRRVQRDLDLSAEQHDQIDKVLKESQERTKKLMEPVAPQLRDELQHAREEFRKLLTPEQRARFDELLKHQPRRGSLKTDGRGTNG